MNDLEIELRSTFLQEALEFLEEMEQNFLALEEHNDCARVLEAIFRLAHNLKGSAGAVGFCGVKDFTHHLESLLLKLKENRIEKTPKILDLLLRSKDHLHRYIEALRVDQSTELPQAGLIAELEAAQVENGGQPSAKESDAKPGTMDSNACEAFAIWDNDAETVPAASATPVAAPTPQPTQPAVTKEEDEVIRVSLKRLDHLMNDIGELVILQTVLQQQRHLVASTLLQKTISQLNKISRNIQDTAMGLRMVPVKQTFLKMQRIVRDVAKSLEKDIDFQMAGEQTEIDKTILNLVQDPLVHLIRNAVDHGIECPDERVNSGKPKKGKILLAATRKSGKLILEISDDGRGLSAENLVAKAKKKNLIPSNASLTDSQAHHLIFMPGFSTKDVVTDISGRGVGLDVVKTNIQRLSGDVQITTNLGKGTTFCVTLPESMSIIEGMVVTWASERFVVPVAAVRESLRPKASDLGVITGKGETLCVRGEWLPLYRLGSALGQPARRDGTENIGIISQTMSGKPFVMMVDDIIGKQQVVTKRLQDTLKVLPGVSGAAILGDGKASLILDLADLVEKRRVQSKTA